MGENAWRWMLGIQAFHSLIYTFLIFGIPESPRWLVQCKKDKETALHILKQIETKITAVEEIRAIEKETAQEGNKESIFLLKYRKPLMLAFLKLFLINFLV